MPCADLRSPLTRSLQLVSSPGAKTQCITSSPATFSTGLECLCAGAKCARSYQLQVASWLGVGASVHVLL